jgi:hypothetical protein
MNTLVSTINNNNSYLNDRSDSIVTAISNTVELSSGSVGDTNVAANDTVKFLSKFTNYGTFELVNATGAIYIDTTDANPYSEINVDIYTLTTDTFNFTCGVPVHFKTATNRFYNTANKHNYFNIKLLNGKLINIYSDTLTYGGGGGTPGSPSEMLNNTTFSDVSSWTMGNGNATITGGVLNFARSTTYASQLQADMITPLSTSTNYRLTFTLSAPDGAVNLRISDPSLGDTYSNFTAYTSGAITIDFSTPATLNYPSERGIRISLQYTEACTIDNISLTER